MDFSLHTDDDLRRAILLYLAERLPGYPFDPALDPDFVDELLDDHPDLDVLEQIKRFRWYCADRAIPLSRNPRGALRRWVHRAHETP